MPPIALRRSAAVLENLCRRFEQSRKADLPAAWLKALNQN